MVEQRRSYTPEEKLKIVLEGLSGTIQISDLCKKYGIKSARYYYWKEELINASNDIFGQKGRKADTDSRLAEQLSEIQRLKDVIAEIKQENLLLKKRQDLRGEKMTDIFKEIRSAVISAESTASFTVTRILRIS